MLKPLSIFKICIQLRVNVYHQQGKGRVKIVKSKQENFPRMLKKISPSYQGMLTFHPRIVFIDAHMRSRIIETKKSLRVSIQRYRPKRHTKQYSTPSLYILAKKQLQTIYTTSAPHVDCECIPNSTNSTLICIEQERNFQPCTTAHNYLLY